MRIVDANVILRYLLQDNEKYSPQAIEIIDNSEVYTTTEVIAEVIYVLIKVYELPRNSVAQKLLLLFEKEIVLHKNNDIIIRALQIFLDTKLDFVDCVLLSYHIIDQDEIISFDKKVNQYIKRLQEKS